MTTTCPPSVRAGAWAVAGAAQETTSTATTVFKCASMLPRRCPMKRARMIHLGRTGCSIDDMITRPSGPGATLLALLLATACAESSGPAVQDTGATIQLVASGLSSPLFVTAPPGDTARLFIVEQTGKIRIARADTLLTVPFLDLGAKVSCCGEQGLLGLAF